MCVCITVERNTTQNSSDNSPSCIPDNHQSSAARMMSAGGERDKFHDPPVNQQLQTFQHKFNPAATE